MISYDISRLILFPKIFNLSCISHFSTLYSENVTVLYKMLLTLFGNDFFFYLVLLNILRDKFNGI